MNILQDGKTMNTIHVNNKNKSLTIISILILPTVFFQLTLQKLSAETVPSFPSPTTVDIEKNPSRINPFESGINNEKLNDPKALNAIRTLIQGGIPVGQSKTQIMDNVTPISQYSSSPSFKTNLNSNAAYRYVVKRGDTLNKIIKATFNQHPLKMKEIRKAIIDNNKKAFPTGKPTSMQAGATLMIPSFGQIAGMTSQEQGVSAMTKQENPYISTDPHRGWVRFP